MISKEKKAEIIANYGRKAENIFCDTAKKHNILIVPGSSFGCAGYVRMAYCVSYDTIVNSLPKFAEVAKEMGVKKN